MADNNFIQQIDPATTPLDRLWINPLGGLGDNVMLSSALKTLVDTTGTRLKMARRTANSWLFQNHPAIEAYTNPPADAIFLNTDYWSHPLFGQLTALEVMHKILGLDPASVEMKMWIPEVNEPAIEYMLPRGLDRPLVIVSPDSASPRKKLSAERWDEIVDRLKAEGLEVVMTGPAWERVPRHAYSLAGVTSTTQLVALVKRADAVVTPDSFIAHVAAAVGTPAVVLFGPTEARHYGYSSNINLSANISECPERDTCIGGSVPGNYSTECPLPCHCMDTIDIDTIVNSTLSLIKTHDIKNNNK